MQMKHSKAIINNRENHRGPEKNKCKRSKNTEI